MTHDQIRTKILEMVKKGQTSTADMREALGMRQEQITQYCADLVQRGLIFRLQASRRGHIYVAEKPLPIDQRILTVLRRGPTSKKRISDEIGLSIGCVGDYLTKMRHCRAVRCHEKTNPVFWELVDESRWHEEVKQEVPQTVNIAEKQKMVEELAVIFRGTPYQGLELLV
jgi:predicted transcriptional regulator